jgi:hypothetical protein
MAGRAASPSVDCLRDQRGATVVMHRNERACENAAAVVTMRSEEVRGLEGSDQMRSGRSGAPDL